MCSTRTTHRSLRRVVDLFAGVCPVLLGATPVSTGTTGADGVATLDVAGLTGEHCAVATDADGTTPSARPTLPCRRPEPVTIGGTGTPTDEL